MSKRGASRESEEKIASVKTDYEKRLNSMKSEFNKMKAMQSEQERARQRHVAQQQELERARRELGDMKRARVKLTQQMREESRRVKKAEQDAVRKMTTLEKEARCVRLVLRRKPIATHFFQDESESHSNARDARQAARGVSKAQGGPSGHHAAAAAPNRTKDARFGAANNGRRLESWSQAVFAGRSKKQVENFGKAGWREAKSGARTCGRLQMNACITHHSGLSKLDEQHMRLLSEKLDAERDSSQLVSSARAMRIASILAVCRTPSLLPQKRSRSAKAFKTTSTPTRM